MSEEPLFSKTSIDSSVNFSEYIRFWMNMQSERNATRYLKDLIVFLIDILDKKSECKTQNIVNTINFISYFVPVNTKDKKLHKALNIFQKDKMVYQKTCGYAEEVLRVLTKRFIDDNESIDSLLIQTSTLHSLEEFEKLTDFIEYAIVRDNDPYSGEFSFVYPYLHTLSRSDYTKQLQILKTCLILLRTVNQQLKMSSKLSECTLLSLLHIMKSIIALSPIHDNNFLQKSIEDLRKFYLWPNPYGSAAKEVLTIFRAELLSSGHAMRARFAKEAQQPMCINSKGDNQYPLYYFLDYDDSLSSILAQKMRLLLYDHEDSNYAGKLAKEKSNRFSPTLPETCHLSLPFKIYDNSKNNKSTLHSRLLNLITAHSATGTQEHPTKLRICIAGSDMLLHTFVCSYGDIMTSNPQLFRLVSLSIYLLPITQNNMAAFLARHDSWYNRYIFIPFRDPTFLLPKVSLSIEQPTYKLNSSHPLTPPGKFLRSLVELFTQDARITYRPIIYQLEGWKKQTPNTNNTLL